MVIDDFLAGGTTADAMLRICRMAGANVVGGGFLIEKVGSAGRAKLSGYQIPIESLAIIEIDNSNANPQVRVIEEAEDESEQRKLQADLDRLLDPNRLAPAPQLYAPSAMHTNPSAR